MKDAYPFIRHLDNWLSDSYPVDMGIERQEKKG